jgi:hypothetical protein
MFIFSVVDAFLKEGVRNNVVQDFSPAVSADLKVCTTEMH